MEIASAQRCEGQVLEGASLPPRLYELKKPPERLFLHGNLPAGPCIGVVGTRRATPEALAFAERLSHALASHGVAVASGGAKGIDAAAHRGALSAGGKTLVVAASSLDCPFPAEHHELYAQVIAAGGGYLSRFDRGMPVQRPHFLERNGILAALCDALVLVEAPLKSGARNATSWARRLGRPYFVVPSPPWCERGRGCILELQLGGRALGDPAEILAFLGAPQHREPSRRRAGRPARARHAASAAADGAARSKQPAQHPPPADSPLPRLSSTASDEEMQAAVLAALAHGALYADDVAEMLGVGVSRVNHALLLSMLSGDVQQGPGGLLTAGRR